MAAEVGETKPKGPLFEGIYFLVIPTKDFPDEKVREVQERLVQFGAIHVPLCEDGRIKNLTDVSHIISNNADFEQYHDALGKYIHVVRPAWVDDCIARGKQTNPRQFSPDPCLVLNGILVTCANIPTGDKEAIAGAVVALGGQFSEILTKQITHIVTLGTDNDKCKMAMAKNLNCKMVIPHWLDHCFRLRRRISEEPYTYPNPEFLELDHAFPRPTPRNADITGAVSPNARTPPDVVTDATKRVPLQVFRHKKIMFSNDLQLSDRIKKNLSLIIEESGGSVTNKISEANTFVCHYRFGSEYVRASQENMTVGNLSWLYYLITYDMWTSPLNKLMHYPVPKGGIVGFNNFKISISNYTGEARVYLEHLIKALGAEFTKTVKHDNTHIITAHDRSEKCDAAREWDIEILNHLWLEESYARCSIQPTTRSIYTTFPSRTNLGEVIGQTPLDRSILEKLYFRRESPNKVRSMPATARNISSDLEVSEGRSANFDAVEGKDDYKKVESHTRKLTSSPAGDAEEAAALQEVDNMDLDESTPTLVQKTKRSSKEKPTRTPVARKVSVGGKENQTPSTSGSRSAKAKAVSKLHDAATDIALYEKQMKRKGGVIHGKERRTSAGKDEEKSTANDKTISSSRKRKSTEIEQDEDSEMGGSTIDVEPHKLTAQKKAKVEKLPPISHRMMITGYDRWDKKPDLEAKEKNKLRNLGIHITEDPLQVTILLAPHFLRTKKFICAIANAPHVVGPPFLDACLKHGQAVDPKKHALSDRDAEARLGFRLLQALDRAKTNRHQLLSGWQIFVTEKVKGGFDTFEAIIKTNGGICTLYKGRTDLHGCQRSFNDVGGRVGANNPAAESQSEDKADTLYLISGTTKAEIELWEKFRHQASKEGFIPVIARTDWLLACAMRQEIVWEEQWELKEEIVDA